MLGYDVGSFIWFGDLGLLGGLCGLVLRFGCYCISFGVVVRGFAFVSGWCFGWFWWFMLADLVGVSCVGFGVFAWVLSLVGLCSVGGVWISICVGGLAFWFCVLLLV